MNLDTSNDLFLVPHLNGIRMVTPSLASTANRFPTVAEALAIPSNVYFLNTDSTIQNTNDPCAETCGFESVSNALGRTVHGVLPHREAVSSTEWDKEVLCTRRSKYEEHILKLHSDTPRNCFTVKSPVYDHVNNIIGIFGCTIIIGLQPLAQSLQLINKVGLLRVPQSSSNIFSTRETEILHQLIRGKSAKQIAGLLHISRRTVEHHIEHMKTKANCASKFELIDLYADVY